MVICGEVGVGDMGLGGSGECSGGKGRGVGGWEGVEEVGCVDNDSVGVVVVRWMGVMGG